jgi:LysM repeat protein
MEWKDSGEKSDQSSQEEYFDEEEYSPWAEGKSQNKDKKLMKPPALFILLAIAVVALIAVLLMLLLNSNGDPIAQQKLDALEGRIMALEERLDKYEAIDEKVTRIWEQAKSFEKFKDRFDRSEASMSLRMDHLTMSLEAMQKQLTASQKRAASPPAGSSSEKLTASPKPKPKTKIKYHLVKAGETLYSISKQYGLKVEELLKLNRMKSGSVIVTGQKLIVPNTSN